MAESLLKVEGLNTIFNTDRGVVRAVNNVSYEIEESEIVGIVGESGCGKSVSQLSVLQLIPTPPGKILSGKAIFEGKDRSFIGADFFGQGDDLFFIHADKGPKYREFYSALGTGNVFNGLACHLGKTLSAD